MPALIGGLVYGVIMAFVLKYKPGPVTRYDLNYPHVDKGGLKWLWRLWPLITLALFGAILAYPPLEGWSSGYVLFQAIFLPFLITAYPPMPGLSIWRHPTSIRLCGVALLLFGLFVAG